MEKLSGVTNGLPKIHGPLEKQPSGPSSISKGPSSNEFLDLIQEKAQSLPEGSGDKTLKFSAHAQKRIHSRSIDLSPEDFLKMQEAVQRARDKGSKESLILTDKAAFVVSVTNNTVITAVDKESLKENVFTNIDSTIMI